MEILDAELLRTSEAFRKGETRVRTFEWHGWKLHVVKAPMQNTAEFYALNRELQLYQTQKVPEATFLKSSVEIQHSATGVVLSFSVLEALRAWRALGADPPPMPAGKSVDWDWTFTTPYTGSLTVTPLG